MYYQKYNKKETICNINNLVNKDIKLKELISKLNKQYINIGIENK